MDVPKGTDQGDGSFGLCLLEDRVDQYWQSWLLSQIAGNIIPGRVMLCVRSLRITHNTQWHTGGDKLRKYAGLEGRSVATRTPL